MSSHDAGRRPSWRARTAVAVVGAMALAFLAGVVIVPWLEAHDVPRAGALRLLYAPLCHQQASRSFTIASRPAAVCARCTGLYVGGVAGLLGGAMLSAGLRIRARPWWLFAAAAPTLVDFGLSWIGLGGLTNLPRAVLAVPAGAVAGVFLSIGIQDLFELRNGTVRGEPLGRPSVREG